MFSIDETFRIRPTTPRTSASQAPVPPRGAAASTTPEGNATVVLEGALVDQAVDPRFSPTFTEDAAPPAGDALSYRLANFHEGRRLKCVAAHAPDAPSLASAAALTDSACSDGNNVSLPNGEAAEPSALCQGGQPTAPSFPDGKGPRSKAAAQGDYRALTAEDDEGDVEYKWRLTGISSLRFEHLVTQMKFRVSEGHGQCLYELGVADDGALRGLPKEDFAESVETIQRMARTLGLDCTILHECIVQREPHPLLCGELLVSRRHSRGQDVSLCFCGALGSGKSTLMAALLTSTLDDGHGSTRQLLFNHKHEIDSGRTTSIATRVWTVSCGPSAGGSASDDEVEVSLVMDDDDTNSEAGEAGEARGSRGDASSFSAVRIPGNELVDDAGSNRETNSTEGLHSSGSDTAGSPLSETPATAAAPPPSVRTPATRPSHPGRPLSHHTGRHRRRPRLVSLMDAGGDITKTSLFALMSRRPDYVCLCVAADGAPELAALYAQVCCAIGTPFLVAVTKGDAVEDFELDGFCMDLVATLHNSVGCACDVVESEAKALEYCHTWLPRHRDGAVDGGLGDSSPYVHQAPRVPVFCVSSVTGGGLDLLKFTIAHLPRLCAAVPMTPVSTSTRPSFEVLLDYVFQVAGVGPVVRGRVSAGVVEVGCACYVGPDETGAFFPVVLRGIHVDGAHVNEAHLGDEATFALDRLPPSVDVSHKGKVLVRQPKNVSSTFRLTVRVLSQSLTPHLEPILYSRNARQAVRIVTCFPRSPVFRPSLPPLSAALGDAFATSAETGASKETAMAIAKEEEFEVECEFLFRPEVLTYDASVVLRWEPKGIAVGRVSRLGPSA